jgi:hypothetical protein
MSWRHEERGHDRHDEATVITQPRTDQGPIIPLDRDEAMVAMAHEQAAAQPPRMATTAGVWQVGLRGSSGTIRLRVRRPNRAREPRAIIREVSSTWLERPAHGPAPARRVA